MELAPNQGVSLAPNERARNIQAKNSFALFKKVIIIFIVLSVIFTAVFIFYLMQKKSARNLSGNKDYQAISSSIGTASGDNRYDASADLNKDGVVDILDYQVLSNNLSK